MVAPQDEHGISALARSILRSIASCTRYREAMVTGQPLVHSCMPGAGRTA